MRRRPCRIFHWLCISLSVICVILVSGRAYGGWESAIPLFSFAPSVKLIPDKTGTTSTEAAPANGKRGMRNAAMGMRGGRLCAIVERKTDEEMLTGLPSADLKWELLTFYVPPGWYRKRETWHYYNFIVTSEYDKALSYYLSGQWKEALAQCDIILANSKNASKLLWQTSFLRVNALIMMGRSDLAEAETVRTEKFEILAMGKHANQTSRALRGEVRYWAGDIEGAIDDAVSVIKAFGTWRFSTIYMSPPRDQVELCRCTNAQVRANIILGLALIAKGQPKEALPWLELANQTMNNVMFVTRHPLYGLYYWAPEEHFLVRGMSLATLGTALMSLDREPERVTKLFARARDYLDAIGYRAGPALINTFKVNTLASLATNGHFEQAVNQSNVEIKHAEKLGMTDYVWRLEAVRGFALIELGRIDEAEKALRHAQTIVDQLTGTMTIDNNEIHFGLGKESIMYDLERIDLKKKDMTKLFEDMEGCSMYRVANQPSKKELGEVE